MSESKKQTILIVDDTPVNIDILDGILESDYQIKAATTGKLALKIAKTQNPDLILLDVMMPEIDGYEVWHKLKAEEQTKNIPIVFVTTNDNFNPDPKIKATKPKFLVKPIDPDIVLHTIKSCLKEKK